MVSTKRRYALHMKDGLPTLEGLLIKRDRRHFMLLDCELLEAPDRTQQLAGPVVVPRENVYCLQEIRR